jgi:UDP-N-acetylmuramoyl-L-alanyl-D-glutamate--2,6-diaminopimelate ligase
MRLSQLLDGILSLGGLPDVDIRGVAADSRQVGPGDLFIAVRGQTRDGHEFLPQAASGGAAALAGEGPDPGLGLPYLRVPDSRLFLAQAAASWHGYPARRMVMIGVTGTDGKTTTSSLLHHILESAGSRTGLITSVGARIGTRQVDTGFHVTTPDPLELQALLGQMVGEGIGHAVVEVTSHGLDQQRVAACDFDLGVLTNITHEHLDYHGTTSAYLAAKARLFQGLSTSASKPQAIGRLAVLNRDDSSFEAVRAQTGVPVADYGESPEAGYRAIEVRAGAAGLTFVLEAPGLREEVKSPLLGRYNLGNCLAAATAAIAGLGIEPAAAAAALAGFHGVPGRMERIDLGQPFLALVDFAHTPNALRRALEAARLLTEGNVIVVYGAAGQRDREKRRLMPEVSIGLARHTVLTAEDPRVESLEVILAEMAAGAEAAGGREGTDYWRVPDRGQAIRFALGLARPGDVVLACGKGHEQSMAFGDVEHPWDDRVAMRAGLAQLLGVPGPAMPRLPTSA